MIPQYSALEVLYDKYVLEREGGGEKRRANEVRRGREVVQVASRCQLTLQYTALEALCKKYVDIGESEVQKR